MSTIYIALAILGASNGYRITQAGRYDTPQAACEASARGKLKQVLMLDSSWPDRRYKTLQCCEQIWLIPEHIASCKAGTDFKWYCWENDFDDDDVTVMDCVAAPSYRVVPSK